jgi:transposase-like protein
VPKKAMKKELAADIRAIFNASDREKAGEYLQWAIEKYAQSAPKLSQWMEENLTEGLTVRNFPFEHRKMIRTTNALERVNREIRRRTRVASIFPNEASC